MNEEAKGGGMRRGETRWFHVVLLAMVLALIAAACGEAGSGDGDEEGAGETGGETVTGTALPGEGVTISIAVNPWTGSAVNANVAKVLLEQQLGYTVELVEIDEFAQFPALSTGELDATLEVWPSGHAEDYATYIDGDGSVVDGGELGVVGNIGWFVPTYVVDANPEVATWEGLNDAASLFATAETGDKGQMLDGDPSFVSYDAEIVENLGLNYEVVVAGSEAALLSELEQAYANEEPILLYWYTPHWANQQYDMTEVELPAVTDECLDAALNNEGDGYACDYAEDVLYKAFTAGLQEKAPAAFGFLSAMSYENSAQEAVAFAIDVDGEDPAAAAQAWVDANQSVWQPWVDAGLSVTR
jgi:glycine betaine/proline transport system substrate-binding protein